MNSTQYITWIDKEGKHCRFLLMPNEFLEYQELRMKGLSKDYAFERLTGQFLDDKREVQIIQKFILTDF